MKNHPDQGDTSSSKDGQKMDLQETPSKFQQRDKIQLDAMEKEKKTSFATLGRNSSGISITFSDDRDDSPKSRRGSTMGTSSSLHSSGPGTPSRVRGLSPSISGEEDLLGSQLNSVRMRLEERRKKIEEEKMKMETVMVKQRERVGQEAFLRAVAKGIKKSGHQEAGDQARSEILELASKIEEKSGSSVNAERRTRPFSLHLQDLARGGSEAVKTPDLEALDISRMSDSLYELQSDIKKLALQQSQIQSMMQPSSTKQSKPESSKQPFFISKPQEEPQQAPSVSQNQPFYISPQPQQQPQQPFHQMPSTSVPQQQQQQLHNMMGLQGHQGHQGHHPPSSSPQQPAAYRMPQHQPPPQVSQSPQSFHVSTNPGQRRTWGQPYDPVPQPQLHHQQQQHHQGPPHNPYEGQHYQGGQHPGYGQMPPPPQRAPYDQQNITMYDPQPPPPSHRRPASYDQRRPPYAVDPAYDPSHFQEHYGGGGPPMAPYRDPGGPYRDSNWGPQQPPQQPPPSSQYNPTYNASFHQTFAPQAQPGGNYMQGGGYSATYQPPPPSYPTHRFPESQDQSPARSGTSSPFRTLSRSSSLRKGDGGRPASANRSRHSSYHEDQCEEELVVRRSPVRRESSCGSVRSTSRELSTSSRATRENSANRESQELSASRAESPSSRPKVTLVPKSPMKPPTAEKPSLSTTFLQQKRLEAAQRSASPPADSHSLSESSQSEMTNSCLETLSTMKTEVLKESEEAKGFVISFDAPGPVKPKPQLKDRRSSKKDLEETKLVVRQSTIEGEDDSIEVTQTMEATTADDCTLMMTTEEGDPDLATPDDEEFSFGGVSAAEPAEICALCPSPTLSARIAGHGLCSTCLSQLRLLQEKGKVGEEDGRPPVCLTGLNCCPVASPGEQRCPACFARRAQALGINTAALLGMRGKPSLEQREETVGEEEKSLRQAEAELAEKKMEWVEMMSAKRKQQAEESRIKREEESRKKREEEESKREESAKKKEEDKKRREEIFQQYKVKKEMEKAKEEGRNFYISKSAPKLRPKSAGGTRPRPRTIHGEKDDVGLNAARLNMRGSQSNISIGLSSGYRSMGRGPAACRRGSNASLHDEPDHGIFGGSLRGLGHIGRSKSSSASNLGPGSLPLGLRPGRGGRDFDDNASDVSSTTSGYRSGRGSARLFREPVSKSNRPIVMNAVEYVVFPGAVNKETRMRVLEEIERCDCPHFLILFRDSKLQFRGLYAYYPDTDEVFKIYGTGPRQVTDAMIERYYKYNSGGKKFTQIHTKHLTVTIDAFTIHNSLWLGKKTKLPDKKDLALVV